MKYLSSSGDSNDYTTFFYTPTNHMPDFFYYTLCIGHYYCDSSYQIARSSYDSFLMIYTKKGSGVVEVDGLTKQLLPGELCLIDCYKPHSYKALEYWEIKWLHFDGGNSRYFFQYLCEEKPFFHTMLKNPAHFELVWKQLYEQFSQKEQLNEIMMSQYISQLLTFSALSSKQDAGKEEYSDYINNTLQYIHRHVNEEITVAQLAERVSLSPYYFLRKFKEEIGYTPYRYILISRIHLAKFFLKTNSESVKTIAYKCGFRTEHSFCTAFKKETGMTPTEYRFNAH